MTTRMGVIASNYIKEVMTAVQCELMIVIVWMITMMGMIASNHSKEVMTAVQSRLQNDGDDVDDEG